MFGSTVLEVAIGMIFVYLLVSLVCSGVGGKISEVLNWRARDLEKGIRELLLGGNQELLNKLYNNKLIQSLATEEYKQVSKALMQVPVVKKMVFQGHPESKGAKPSETTGEEFPARYPTNIPARTFVLALFDAFVPKEAGGQTSVTDLRNTIATKMPDSVVKQQLLALVTGADEKIENARDNVETWFNAAEAQMTLMYKQHMFWIALIIGLAVSVFFNVDSAALATTLWRDPTLRAAVVAQATQYANQNQAPTTAASQAAEQINNLNLPAGWQFAVRPSFVLYPSDFAQLPQPAGGSAWLLKIIGWVITALAGAQGAPFWFDALKKLTAKPQT